MSNFVLVIDTNKKPLTPCKPSVAKRLLDTGRAAAWKRYPFTIILKKEVNTEPKPLTLKIDPGSKTTGFAIVQGNKVIFGAELTHRGQSIKASLESRRALRRSRRNRHTRYRHTRYRQPRFFEQNSSKRLASTFSNASSRNNSNLGQ